MCKSFGDPTKARAWSKHTKEAKEDKKVNRKREMYSVVNMHSLISLCNIDSSYWGTGVSLIFLCLLLCSGQEEEEGRETQCSRRSMFVSQRKA